MLQSIPPIAIAVPYQQSAFGGGQPIDSKVGKHQNCDLSRQNEVDCDETVSYAESEMIGEVVTRVDPSNCGEHCTVTILCSLLSRGPQGVDAFMDPLQSFAEQALASRLSPFPPSSVG